MKRIKVTLTLLMICFSGVVVNAQSVDSRLWGEWKLESMQQTIVENNKEKETKTLLVQSIIAQRSSLEEDVFLLLYMFENIIGVCSTNNYTNFVDVNDKGSFATKDNHLTITLNSRLEPLTLDFTYYLSGEKLFLTIDQPSKKDSSITYRRQLVYVLIFKEDNK